MLNEIIFTQINSLAGKNIWLDRLAVFFAVYSGYILLAVLIYLWLVKPRSCRFSVTAVVAALVARGIFTTIIRFFYHHPRPFDAMAVHQLIPESGASFPSGHAAFFFALSVPIYVYNKKLGIIFYAVSILMGLARIFTGVHWPADIIGGAILGILIGWVSLVISNKTKPPKGL